MSGLEAGPGKALLWPSVEALWRKGVRIGQLCLVQELWMAHGKIRQRLSPHPAGNRFSTAA